VYIANLRVTHKDTPHEKIDGMILPESKKNEFYKFLLKCPNVEEAIVLQTCNRFEVYFSGTKEKEGRAEAKEALLDWFGEGTVQHLISDSYVDTLTHLFRVSSSLDSMIVGENQIQTQVREALDYASKNRFSGRILEPVFQKAISVGKRARSETMISKGKVSISSAAVDLANQHNSLEGKSVVLIGTGKMASLLSEYLLDFGNKELVVVGRSKEKLENFCTLYQGIPCDFTELPDRIREADIIFSATSSPRVLVTKEIVENATSERISPLTLIDIAMPADIDPAVSELQNVHYFSIEDLKEISERNLTIRKSEVEKVEIMIGEELMRFKNKLQNLHIENFLSNLYKYTEEIREREVDKAKFLLRKCDPEVLEVMEGLSKALMKKVLHNFIMEARENPMVAMDIEKFVNIFLGNGHVSEDKNKKAKGHPSDKGDGD
jgi:glutamyl-tRNA reductase